MKYLENTLKFLVKHILLAIPLFIVYVIPAIISEPINIAMMAQSKEIANMVKADPTMIKSFEDFLELYSILLPSMRTLGIISLVSLIPLIFVVPATYGMVNKALKTGKVGLTDFFTEFAENVGKYILFILATTIFYFGIGLVIAVLTGICVALVYVSLPLGIVASILLAIVVAAGLYASTILLLFWFPAMVSDNLGVIDALKKSFSVGKSYFWYTVAVSLIISAGTSGISYTANIIQGIIPVIGSVIKSAVATLSQLIMIVFAFEVYRDKTGKNEYINSDNNEDIITDTSYDYFD